MALHSGKQLRQKCALTKGNINLIVAFNNRAERSTSPCSSACPTSRCCARSLARLISSLLTCEKLLANPFALGLRSRTFATYSMIIRWKSRAVMKQLWQQPLLSNIQVRCSKKRLIAYDVISSELRSQSSGATRTNRQCNSTAISIKQNKINAFNSSSFSGLHVIARKQTVRSDTVKWVNATTEHGEITLFDDKH